LTYGQFAASSITAGTNRRRPLPFRIRGSPRQPRVPECWAFCVMKAIAPKTFVGLFGDFAACWEDGEINHRAAARPSRAQQFVLAQSLGKS